MKRIILTVVMGLSACCSPNSPTNVFATESGLEYKIRVEFALPIEYSVNYPFINRAFKDAVAEWAKHVPIDPVFIPYHTLRPRVFTVSIAPNPFPGAPLGLYFPITKSLFLNSISLLDYDDAYDVALHEIGHALGLKHVGSQEADYGILTGDTIIMGDPEPQLMYPYYTPRNYGAVISDLDIQIVREYIKTQLVW
jgi:hypothetical protein